ncbi:hypothetical protein KKG63_03595 [Patescibacteria group bacterium]|nr:hypothetical protein [Patescibacteria group bacterium]MBU1999475.1 hypothetical protein [Candidatus Omnitrophota bacterium]
MIQIRNNGNQYRGFDDDNVVFVQSGGTVWVSLDKANQLLKDFPNDWVKIEEEIVKEPVKEPKKKPGRKPNGKRS